MRGYVLDTDSEEPLVFAHVVVNEGPYGTTTDLTGFFEIRTVKQVEKIKVKYIGYETKEFTVSSVSDTLTLKLKKSSTELGEVKVFPGENPAEIIMKNVVKNRKDNDPSQLPYFTYKAYEKTIFTLDEDTSITNKRSAEDTMLVAIRNLLDKQHIMMSENVYERKYRNGKYTD